MIVSTALYWIYWRVWTGTTYKLIYNGVCVCEQKLNPGALTSALKKKVRKKKKKRKGGKSIEELDKQMAAMRTDLINAAHIGQNRLCTRILRIFKQTHTDKK